ncbi:MAG: hypothetical protein ACHQRM_06325 [Bacteroidia bacterium]
MDTPFLPPELSGPEKQAILKAVIEQLMKDFGRFGLDIREPLPGTDAYSSLQSQVAPIIEKTLLSNDSLLTGILYSIDLSEVQVRKALQEQPERPYPLVLTDLILKRELQKVVLRKRFS